MAYNPFHSVNANYHSTKRKRNKKRKQFRKDTSSRYKKKVDTKGMPTKKKQGTLFVPDSQKHWQKHSRKPNNNPSTRGKQMK